MKCKIPNLERRLPQTAGLVLSLLLATGLLLFGQSSGPVENWPQWRGPSSAGVSDETGLPTEWSLQRNVAWKARLAGLGASSPIVWEDRIFVTSQVGDATVRPGSHPKLARADEALAGRENPIGGRRPDSDSGGRQILLTVEAFNRFGERLWSFQEKGTGPFPELHEKHNLATPTPVTDGRRVYAWFGNGQLFCLDLEGNLIWKRHLGLDYSPFFNQWGHGSSPVLYDDLLILLCDHRPESYLLALDKASGEERWKADRGAGRVSHSTPLLIHWNGTAELIVNSSERIDSYAPETGALLWYAGSERQTPIPSPVFHNGLLYLSRGYRNSDYLALRPGGHGDVSESHILWRTAGGASYVPSILYYRGLLYVTNEVGVVTAADADTGETVWRRRLGGVFFASPVAADGKIYLVSETGETFVLQAGSEGELLARNDLGERLIASPAVSGGQLFLRSDEDLFAISQRN